LNDLCQFFIDRVDMLINDPSHSDVSLLLTLIALDQYHSYYLHYVPP